MKSSRILIVGCGVIGTRVGEQLLQQGYEVAGLRRDPAALPAGFLSLAGDYSVAADMDAAAAFQPDQLLFTPVPAGRDAHGYRRGYLDGIRAMTEAGVLNACERAVMVSSTRVYAEAEGGWVDETSALSTTDEPAQIIAAAENAFLGSCSGASVLRASGIYGRWPGMLLSRVARGEASADPNRIGNRIHRDDLVGAITFVLTRSAAAAGVINVTDSAPVPVGEVERWLAAQLGVKLQPPLEGYAVGRGNRRCANTRLQDLGYALVYPDYKAGYGALLQANRSKWDDLMTAPS